MSGPSKPLRRLNVFFGCVLALLAMIAIDAMSPFGLSYNHSVSLPRGLYWHYPAPSSLMRGSLVCFYYTAPDWAKPYHYLPEDTLICKAVLGLPGDAIKTSDDEVTICTTDGQCKSAGRIRKIDSLGHSVMAAKLPQRIPEGKLYLGSTRVANSFDSRYLGLIDKAAVVREVRPLLTE